MYYNLSKKDQKLKEHFESMFPKGTSEQFIMAMVHSLKGKQEIWDSIDMNDDSKSDREYFGSTD
jgi:hypothetical protein